MTFAYPPGVTPIDGDEAAGLIPAHITLQSQLNEYEQANILVAVQWLSARRRGDPLDDRFVLEVHRRMFDRTWRWAGQPRRSDKNIGAPWHDIPARLRQLLDDTRAQIEHRAYPPAEIAARYHHRLVTIHVFANGNGRHARIMGDLLLNELEGRPFDWGRGSLEDTGELRVRYIAALQSADDGDYGPLLAFLDPPIR